MTRRQDISDKPTGQDWPLDGGETGALIRTHDWAATALGLSEDWPERLRAVVDLVLDQHQQDSPAGDVARCIGELDAAVEPVAGRAGQCCVELGGAGCEDREPRCSVARVG